MSGLDLIRYGAQAIESTTCISFTNVEDVSAELICFDLIVDTGAGDSQLPIQLLNFDVQLLALFYIWLADPRQSLSILRMILILVE